MFGRRGGVSIVLAFAMAAALVTAQSSRAAQNSLQAEYRQLLTYYNAKQWNEVAARAPTLLGELEATNQGNSPGYSEILELTALSLMYAGRYQEVEPYLKRALAWQQTAHG